MSYQNQEGKVYLDAVLGKSGSGWFTELKWGRHGVQFKLDTGAEVSVISEKTYRNVGQPALHAPDKMLFGASHCPLQVLGHCKAKLWYKNNRASVQTVYVVKGLSSNLLGLPAITALNLAARVEAIDDLRARVLQKFPAVFQGLGNLGDEYNIQLKPDAKPFCLFTPRNVPLPLRQKVKMELDKMESMGVISKMDEPTLWCAGMVVAPKKGGAIRICVDLKPLNENVIREVHPLPKVDEILAQLSEAKVFSKLDANSGFWQIPLSQSSRPLTTFITPYGRYCFNKMPFGISSAPEHFQKRMNHILTGLNGVLCLMDDVLIFAKDQAEHDKRLEAALTRIQVAGATLNLEKCEFGKTQIKFLGHLIDGKGIHPDPEKVSAILNLQNPVNVTELRRLMGMINQLGKFSSHLAEMTQPLRALLSKNQEWVWGPDQEKAFDDVKKELTLPTVLVPYNLEAETKISADASSYGLGAVLLQKCGALWKPVAFASKSMTQTERHYAQIEKEALAVTWACERFSVYVLGRRFIIETDHKPLIPLLGSKNLDSLPPRVLRFRLRLTRFDYSIVHVPGKLLYTADALSRAPVASTESSSTSWQDEAELLVEAIIADLPAGKNRIKEYSDAQATDPVCSAIANYCRNGWPKDKKGLSAEIAPYWSSRGELTICGNLLLNGNRIVVPKSMQKLTLTKIHNGHLGIQRCHLRAKAAVWWPGITHQLTNFVKQCPKCAKEFTPKSEPLISTKLPSYPWQKVATDIFHNNGANYLLTVDYFSRFPEVVKLTSTTSLNIIDALKDIFARHGIPETVMSDNGPQYSSLEFFQFSQKYNFQHITSSPYYPQSNGHVERGVQTVKKLFRLSSDPHLALLSYRSTPLPWCGRSPAELLMGRQLRTDLPQREENLIPKWSYLKEFKEQDTIFKARQKRDFDHRHRAYPSVPYPEGTDVWVKTKGRDIVPGTVLSDADTPRSYIIQTPTGQLQRNRIQLNVQPDPSVEDSGPMDEDESIADQSETASDESDRSTADRPTNLSSDRDPPQAPPHRIMTRSQTGTVIHPPDRYSP